MIEKPHMIINDALEDLSYEEFAAYYEKKFGKPYIPLTLEEILIKFGEYLPIDIIENLRKPK